MEFLSKFFKSFGKDKDKDEEKKKLPLPKIAAWSGGTTVSCDGCRAIIPLDTWRYHCTECNNFDFCRDCYKAKKAEHGHYFAKETGDPHRNAERIGKAPALWECFEFVQIKSQSTERTRFGFASLTSLDSNGVGLYSISMRIDFVGALLSRLVMAAFRLNGT